MTDYNLAERSVIGSVLIDPACVPDVVRTVEAEDFTSETHREIFRVIREMHLAGDVIDVVTVLERMRGAEADTKQYFLELMELTPTAANALKYAAIVKEQAKRRALSEIAEQVSADALWGEDWQTAAGRLNAAMEHLAEERRGDVVNGQSAVETWQKWFSAVQKDPSHAVVRTGFRYLDAMLGGGFFKTGFYVIGARPGMGKTTCSLNLAEYIASLGKRVLYLSLEMDEVQITTKRLSLYTGISYTALYNGRVLPDDMERMDRALEKIERAPMDVISQGCGTVEALSMLLRLRREYDIVFVDYIGLMTPPEADAQRPKYEQMTNLSRDLKALAKGLNIPIVALSQLNRESQARQNKRPSLSDLRDSGAIEQDADGVILLHREGYYEDGKPEREEIEFIIAKNRHGTSGTVRLMWDGASGRIYEISGREESK